jgi:hypothetical protein
LPGRSPRVPIFVTVLAGNGYAFLELYRRTKDPMWFERARAFAMTATARTFYGADLDSAARVAALMRGRLT